MPTKVDRNRTVPGREVGELWGEEAAVADNAVHEHHRWVPGPELLVAQAYPVPVQPRHGRIITAAAPL